MWHFGSDKLESLTDLILNQSESIGTSDWVNYVNMITIQHSACDILESTSKFNFTQ